MASAPNLLSACEESQHLMENILNYGAMKHEHDADKVRFVMKIINDAIAKAKGDTK